MIIEKFRELAACNAELAQTLDKLGLNDHRYHNRKKRVLNKLIRQGVIVFAGANTYFLDERMLLNDRLNKMKWGMIGLIGMLMLVFYLLKYL
jgi:hypothetical protein